MERKSNGNVNYIAIDSKKKTVWFRRGMFGNATTTNREFCENLGLKSILDVVVQDLNSSISSNMDSILQTSNLNSVNMSQALQSTFMSNNETTVAKKIRNNCLLSQINKVEIKIPNQFSRHEDTLIQISSSGGKSVLESLSQACGGTDNINPNLLKKQ